MATLVTLQGPNAGRQFPLALDCSLIGRHPGATVYLESLAVSRQHARILRVANDFFVEDADSNNGTFLNGQQIHERMPLTEKDALQIGPYVLGLRPDPLPHAVDTDDPIIRAQVKANPSNSTLYLQNPAYKLQVVLEIARHLACTLERERLLDKLLDHLMRLFPQAGRGLVLLCEQDRLVVGAERGHGDTPSYSRTLVQRALAEGISILSEDVSGDMQIPMSATLINLKLRSFLCVPLIDQNGRRFGIIQLDGIRPGLAFRSEDLGLLTAIALQVTVVLENAVLHAERLLQQRLQQELALAREIQQGFLPTDFKPLGRDSFELFARVHAARDVSGDLYDFFSLGDGRLAFFLGDVSGKGMPAALFMVAVRTLCRHLASSADSPARTLARLNDALAADNPSRMFVTLVHGIYDPSSGDVILASAGHPLPLLRSADGRVEMLPVRNGRLLGYPGGDLGLSDSSQTLRPDDTLILYTDGFTESRGPDGETMFGLDRFCEAVGGARTALSLEACAAELAAAVQRFTCSQDFQDDWTVLLLRHHARQPEASGQNLNDAPTC